MSPEAPSIRHLRPVSPPLASYLRPAKRDLSFLGQLAAEGLPVGSGVILDAHLLSEGTLVAAEARERGLEVVLDSKSLELSTVGGFSRRPLASLPWAGESIHVPETFLADGQTRMFAMELAECAVAHEVSAVLAPTHYLNDELDWLDIDSRLVRELRMALNSVGAQDVPIYYPLASSLATLRGPVRRQVVRLLSSLPIDAVWLRIHNFGTSSSGPLSLRRYVDLARDLHELGVPIVAERTGTVGLALLSLGAVGGIESGITMGERFDYASLKRSPSGTAFLPPPKVYIPTLGAFLSRSDAETLLQRRGMRMHVCQGAGCCQRGAEDMIANPRRHFVVSRSLEVSELSSLPAALRPGRYLESFLRPATDRITRAMDVVDSLERDRIRLDRWRGTIGAMLEEAAEAPPTVSSIPQGQRLRRRSA